LNWRRESIPKWIVSLLEWTALFTGPAASGQKNVYLFSWVVGPLTHMEEREICTAKMDRVRWRLGDANASPFSKRSLFSRNGLPNWTAPVGDSLKKLLKVQRKTKKGISKLLPFILLHSRVY